MARRQNYIALRWFFGLSLLALVGLVSAALIHYPAVIATAGRQAPTYLLLFVLALLIYGGFAFFRTRTTTPAERLALRQGTFWGLLCGGVWIIEIVVANLLGPQLGALQPLLYFGSTLIGYLLPGLAAALVAQRTRRIGAGLQAGLLCGMLGGLIIFLATFVLGALLIPAGQHDPQTLQEFQRSGLPDLTTYIVGDYVAGMITHLWLGLITGAGLGVLGGLLGTMLPPLPESA